MPSTTGSNYVDHSTQTNIQGLARDSRPAPRGLSPPPSAPIPQHQPTEVEDNGVKDNGNGQGKATDMSPAQDPPRKKRPPFNARISLPTPDIDAEGPRSPPPTYAAMSPLPAANRLHAGHTPIIPRSRSPLQEPDRPEPEPKQDESGHATPDRDPPLSGALTLPSHPGDGADDKITVKTLDAELEKIAKEQRKEQTSSTEPDTENGGDTKREEQNETAQRSSADDVEDIDGVLLKKNTKMNMGAPLGQA